MTARLHRWLLSISAVWAIGGMLAADRAVYAQAFSLTVGAKTPLVLGEVSEVPVAIEAPETPETEDRPLRIAVNVGQFSEVEKVSPGTYRATYHLPETRFPQVALVAVWRETGPEAPIEFLRIPLSGRTKLPVKSTKGAEIRVIVGDETYGPVVADARGKAELMIAVPPGVTEVVATSSKARELSQGTVAVDVPPYNRLTLAVTPYLVPADGGSSVTVHAFYDVEKDPPPIERLKLAVEKGELRPIGQSENRYKYRFVPTRGTEANEVRLRASVAGDKASRAEAVISLGLPTPERIVSRGLASPLVADGASSADMTVLVLDRLGLGVPNLVLTASAASGGNAGQIREVGRGEYAISVRGPAQYPKSGTIEIDVSAADTHGSKAQVEARLPVQVAAPAWPVRAEMEPEPSLPIADGETAFFVRIAAFDAADRPFAGGGLVVRADAAEVSPVERTDGAYRARIVPKRGIDALDLSITDEGGHLASRARIPLIAPPSLISVGAFVGGAYNAIVVPTGGIEATLRPPILERRLTAFLRASYREVSRTISIAGVPPLDTKLQLLPISLGAAYDYLRGSDLRAYVGAAFEIVPFAEREEGAFQGRTVFRRIAPGAELVAGAAYDEVFLEVDVTWANLTSEALLLPRPAFLLVAGYRFALPL
jgi:hypothetical protein